MHFIQHPRYSVYRSRQFSGYAESFLYGLISEKLGMGGFGLLIKHHEQESRLNNFSHFSGLNPDYKTGDCEILLVTNLSGYKSYTKWHSQDDFKEIENQNLNISDTPPKIITYYDETPNSIYSTLKEALKKIKLPVSRELLLDGIFPTEYSLIVGSSWSYNIYNWRSSKHSFLPDDLGPLKPIFEQLYKDIELMKIAVKQNKFKQFISSTYDRYEIKELTSDELTLTTLQELGIKTVKDVLLMNINKISNAEIKEDVKKIIARFESK